MIDILREPTLVLNQLWVPISTITVQDALTMLFGEFKDAHGKILSKANILDIGMDENGNTIAQEYSWEQWEELPVKEGELKLRAGGFGKVYRVPEIIIAKRYKFIPKNQLNFNRKNLFKRDQGTCQYCGATGADSMDHVVPRSRGGKNGWENCVVACFACNQRKKDHLLSEVDMKLLKKPSKPGLEIFTHVRNRKRSWEIFFKK